MPDLSRKSSVRVSGTDLGALSFRNGAGCFRDAVRRVERLKDIFLAAAYRRAISTF